MQARTTSDTLPVGTFTTVPVDTKKMTCNVTDDSVTHANKNIKTNQNSYTWKAPDMDVGDIKFT